MIYDKLEKVERYLGIHPNLDLAVHYIMTHSLTELPDGRTELCADKVYINTMNARTAPANQQGYEIHKNYMDIQIDLSGTEIIEIGDTANASVHDYNPATDFGTADCPRLVSCAMGPGNFIICMPQEPHKPGVAQNGTAAAVRKCVFKVHI